MTDPAALTRYFVVTCVLKYASFDEARSSAPDAIKEHIKRSKELHQQGKLLMAGAFIDASDDPLSTMAVTVSHEAAEDYLRGDPFFKMGMIASWTIREWANMFAS